MPFALPPGWTALTTLDAHTGGEPLRVVTGGWPAVPGDTILAKRRHCQAHLEHLRRALMLEPRGHADMYGCVLTEPVTPDGDVGVLFLHNEGYSTMCGHGIIALVTVGLEAELFTPRDPAAIRIDTPAGRVLASAERAGGRIARVAFENVPSFLLERDLALDVPGLGRVTGDLAYGGAFYMYVDAASVGVAVEPVRFAELVDVGMRIKHAFEEQHRIEHPDGDADLNFLYGTILSQPGLSQPGAEPVAVRNVCVFAAGEVDRSPTGTGVSGRAAALHARGELALGQPLVFESLIGTRFEVELVRATEVGGHPAVVPRVTGSAHLTGRHEFWVDPADPLAGGVLLR